MKLANLIGEATEYDKKREVEMKKPKSWLKSVSAFANGNGGMLVFGIADNDEIIGVDDIKTVSEFVSQKIKERIDPFPQIDMRIHKTEQGKNILILEVVSGQETPYFYRGDGTIEAFIRIGNETVIADGAELKRLVLRGKNSSYDSLISDCDFKDYSFSKLRERFKSWNGSSMPEKAFQSFGIVDDKGKLTNAGALFADDCPIRCSRLFCTRWNGLDKSGGHIDALDSAEYIGSLIILLNEGVSFVKRNMKTLWKKTPNSRIEMPDYCERSVFESLVNALVHRDYLINGSEVHVDIFDDRLVIYSPGGMPDGTKIQEREIDTVPSTRRNPVLADIFSRLGYMEREGSGLNKIIDAYEHAVNYTLNMTPEFYSNEVQFNVTLKNLNYNNSKKPVNNNEMELSSDKVAVSSDIILTVHEEKILGYLQNNDVITNAIAREIIGLSESGVRKVLKKMVDKQILLTTGANRDRKYYMSN